MIVTHVSQEYTLPIPDEIRESFGAGQEVVIGADVQGRLVVTPIEYVRTVLQATFGLWADRSVVPGANVAYMMDEIR
jgi:bifunctional DNA-binding transcriptional regulator/antitoxin component of YhaV-PrlF toxin-antitoxin module